MTRAETLQQKMREEKIDVLMAQSRPNVFYISGFDADPHERLLAVLLFAEADPLVICPAMEINQIKKIIDAPIIGYSDTENPWEKLQQYLSKKQIAMQTIALESGISWSRLKEWQRIAPDSQLVEADGLLTGSRLIKSAEEQSYMKEAAALADQGIAAGIAALKEGITEVEVVAAIEYALKKKGVREMSFQPMVLFGGNGGDPHGVPGSTPLQKGSSVLFDLGVMWKGYASDITRTVFFGEPDEESRRVYETVLRALQTSLSAAAPGETIGRLDHTARSVIEEAGYGEYFPHRIGHGIGIDVHELPSMHANNNDLLKPGMTFTIEPGIYIPGKIGVRIEDDVLLTEDGAVTLTKTPVSLTVV
ncbi:M24 family metallopeptidase [Alkalicoccus luteus]|uniref:Aminopeptidase P family protein n=1 Tax=Alkalicoccus luteus TaxID=1237094 RepID=A0A969TU59_9BACI|nr:Xaa-Pro peptidase family protein [Alkalicoccus luteus]NJP37000.1 aminopeptidase P family protein [Alkalicoccus luteus]